MLDGVLPELAEKMEYKLVVTFASVETFGGMRADLGIDHEELPAISLIYNDTATPYPVGKYIDLDSLMEFCESVMDGTYEYVAPPAKVDHHE